MKKYLFLILSFLLIACANNNNNNVTTDILDNAMPVQTETIEKPH